MIDKERVEKKLNLLEGTLTELEKLSDLSYETLTASLQKQWAAEHGLQLAIQTLLDIGSHILVEAGERGIDNYTDVIKLLGEKDVLPVEFANSIKSMAGLRNILVHEYTEVDLNVIFKILNSRLEDFRRFISFIRTYIDKN